MNTPKVADDLATSPDPIFCAGSPCDVSTLTEIPEDEAVASSTKQTEPVDHVMITNSSILSKSYDVEKGVTVDIVNEQWRNEVTAVTLFLFAVVVAAMGALLIFYLVPMSTKAPILSNQTEYPHHHYPMTNALSSHNSSL